jgi:hypothetical protein
MAANPPAPASADAAAAAAAAALAAAYTLEDGAYTYTAPDGARYRWDAAQQAWQTVVRWARTTVPVCA